MKKSKLLKNKNICINADVKNFIKTQLINFSVFLLIFLLSSLLCFISGSKKSEIYVVSIISFSLSSFICAYLSALKSRKNGIVTGVSSIVLPVFFFELTSALINGFSIDYQIIVTTLIIIFTASVGGIAGVNTRLKPKKKRGK